MKYDRLHLKVSAVCFAVFILIGAWLILSDNKTARADGTLPIRYEAADGDPQASPIPQPSGFALPSGFPALPSGFPALPTGFPALPTGVPKIPTGNFALPTGFPNIPTGAFALPTGFPAIPTGTFALPTGFPSLPKGMPSLPTRTPATPTGSKSANPTASPSSSISLDRTSVNIVCGKTTKLTATVTGSKLPVLWISSDPTVASVDSTGIVRGRKAGQVTVTAIVGLKKADCKVTVLYQDVTDSKDFWYTPTNYLTAKGVVKGYDDQTKFKPANDCTRAQMVTFIWRLAGQPLPKSATCKFKDVSVTDYYYLACIWGNENRIVEGYKDGTFGPNIVCARRHAVTFLWRLAGQPEPSSSKNKFSDVYKSDYYYKATLWASEKGILKGYNDGTFRPNGNCLRRQMVTLLYKYDKYINGGK